LRRWHLQRRWNRFTLSCHPGQFPKLQTRSYIWFKESNGRGLVRIDHQFCTMLGNVHGWYLKF
jgi:hypothetical protein